MQNLDQIRALNALKATENTRFSGKANGEVVKKVPVMIQQNGILAALAFASETKKDGTAKNPGHALVFAASIIHCQVIKLLNKPIIPLNNMEQWNIVPEQDTALPNSLRKFSELLCQKEDFFLRGVTAEILAFLNYLRRYAEKDAE